MPEHVIELVSEALQPALQAVRGSRVLVLGVAYKADIDDVRESPSLDIMEKAARTRRPHRVLRPARAIDQVRGQHPAQRAVLGREPEAVRLLRDRDRAQGVPVPQGAELAKTIVDTRNA